jgi:transcriptional regulator with XRE-family HTH domain
VSPEVFLRKVAARLKRARWRQGLTQEEAAVRSRVTMRYYAEIERGWRNPTLVTLYDIVRAMKVSLTDVVDVEAIPHVALDELDLHPPPRGRKPRPRRKR